MEFKNGTSIIFSRFSLVYQIILYIFLAFLIVGLIAVCIFVPAQKHFLARADVQAEVEELKAEWNELSENGGSLMTFVRGALDSVKDLWRILQQDTGLMALVICSIIILYILGRFLISLLSFPMSDVLSGFMSSGAKVGLLHSFVRNFKASAKFALADTLISAPANVLVMVIVVSIIGGLFPTINFFGLTFALIVWLGFMALKAMLLAGWLPAFLESSDKKVWKALKESMKVTKARKGDIFGAMAVVYFLVYAAMMVFALPTFGLAVVVAYALLYLAIRTLELVFHYSVNGRKFYTSVNSIVDPRAIAEQTELQTVFPSGEKSENENADEITEDAENNVNAEADESAKNSEVAETSDDVETSDIAEKSENAVDTDSEKSAEIEISKDSYKADKAE